MRMFRIAGSILAGTVLWLAPGAAPAAGSGHAVKVVERDFHISLSTHSVAAGTVTFKVQNHGPDSHELIVVHDDGTLPLRGDGMTVDEEGLGKEIVGQLEPARAGAMRTLSLELGPGHYMILCNMYGHYMGGMHSVLLAR